MKQSIKTGMITWAATAAGLVVLNTVLGFISRQAEVRGQSAIECLHNLEVRLPSTRQWLYDKQGDLLPQVQFYVNGEGAYADELTKALEDGNELLVLLAIGGGRGDIH